MNDAELFEFTAAFKSLARVFPLRGEDYELNDVSASYFRAMRRFPLRDVQAGAERWLQQGKRFPKPAEWIESIPRKARLAEVVALSELEAAEYLAAEKKRYEDAPCVCRECVAADVTGKPLRFVPETHPDGTDRRVKVGDRIVVAGHWAHGPELARWYRARADFYDKALSLGHGRNVLSPGQRKSSFQERMDRVFWKAQEEPPQ